MDMRSQLLVARPHPKSDVALVPRLSISAIQTLSELHPDRIRTAIIPGLDSVVVGVKNKLWWLAEKTGAQQ